MGEISAEYLHFAGPLSVAITDFVRAPYALYSEQPFCFRPFYGCARIQRDAGYQTTNPYVHRPVVVKRTVIGSKGGWKLSTIFLSCKVLHDWSIIKLRKYIVFIRRVYLCWGVSQNVPSQTPPNWSKRPQHTKTRLVKRPHKTSPF